MLFWIPILVFFFFILLFVVNILKRQHMSKNQINEKEKESVANEFVKNQIISKD